MSRIARYVYEHYNYPDVFKEKQPHLTPITDELVNLIENLDFNVPINYY